MKKHNEAIKFASYITEFLNSYAPQHLSTSSHTLKSYKSTITSYLKFLQTEKGITAEAFGRDSFSKENIEDWLLWLKKQGRTPGTCNNRLSSLRAFLKYLERKDISNISLRLEADAIPLRKTVKRKVRGLSREAVKCLLEAPNQNTMTGRRDITLMATLYSTAARIDEALSLKISDLSLRSDNPCITVTGKGNKTRTLAVSKETRNLLEHYIQDYHGEHPNQDSYLFYSRNKGNKEKLTQPAVAKRLRLHAAKAHEKCTDVPLNLHAHQFRHAKASHWLEDGINIVQISFLLGHELLETTMVYLDVTYDQKAKAIASLDEGVLEADVPKWKGKEQNLMKLCGLV